ncbi:uncharacterized protein LOC111387997 [Olea europaea var. sylvestris]|uniref:uncharacterized protein LOC111387997 n=1 Tax=Olea europaea var. sylvestris TaxID=158386 RepID=UPI000C1D6A28|nr:uncharacterized protein LOC111387997 [Olea europaea var. sylvestris]
MCNGAMWMTISARGNSWYEPQPSSCQHFYFGQMSILTNRPQWSKLSHTTYFKRLRQRKRQFENFIVTAIVKLRQLLCFLVQMTINWGRPVGKVQGVLFHFLTNSVL